MTDAKVVKVWELILDGSGIVYLDFDCPFCGKDFTPEKQGDLCSCGARIIILAVKS